MKQVFVFFSELAITHFLAADQVQWHRSWAEMLRWLEEFELKHIEFFQCIQTFQKLHLVFAESAKCEDRKGYATFARRQAAMYQDLQIQAKDLFGRVGEPRLTASDCESAMVVSIQLIRQNELTWLELLALPTV